MTASTKSAGKGTGEHQPPLVVIFLDIDGVMLPFGHVRPYDGDDGRSGSIDNGNDNQQNNKNDAPIPVHFPDRCCAALARILQQVPAAQLVLSSTWRVRERYREQIIQALHDFCDRSSSSSTDIATGMDRLRKLREFYDVTDIYLHSTRQEEIHQWLEKNKDELGVNAWLALDDEELVLGDDNRAHASTFAKHVVKTESERGLTRKGAQRAVELLEAQLQQSSGRSL